MPPISSGTARHILTSSITQPAIDTLAISATHTISEMPDYSRLDLHPSSVDVLSGLRPSSLQALPAANPTAPHPLLTPHCPCFSFPFSFFSLFFLLQERCMNITAVRRLSSTLSHLSKNIPKMAYQTRIIGVSFWLVFFCELCASSEHPRHVWLRIGPFVVIRWQQS